MAQAWILSSGEAVGHSHIVWKTSPLLMGHNWLNCADRRGSCGIPRGVMDHERLLKCPVIHSLIPFTVKLPTSGEEPGHSHTNLSIYNRGTLVFCELFLFLTDQDSHKHFSQQILKLQKSSLVVRSMGGGIFLILSIFLKCYFHVFILLYYHI